MPLRVHPFISEWAYSFPKCVLIGLQSIIPAVWINLTFKKIAVIVISLPRPFLNTPAVMVVRHCHFQINSVIMAPSIKLECWCWGEFDPSSAVYPLRSLEGLQSQAPFTIWAQAALIGWLAYSVVTGQYSSAYCQQPCIDSTASSPMSLKVMVEWNANSEGRRKAFWATWSRDCALNYSITWRRHLQHSKIGTCTA